MMINTASLWCWWRIALMIYSGDGYLATFSSNLRIYNVYHHTVCSEIG